MGGGGKMKTVPMAVSRWVMVREGREWWWRGVEEEGRGG